MLQKTETLIARLAALFELALSLLILAAVIFATLPLAAELLSNPAILKPERFDLFLERALSLAVGIEFMKMLVKRSPSAVIEVLLFAIARQLIVYHITALETLCGVLSVGLLFLVRKYLFLPDSQNVSIDRCL